MNRRRFAQSRVAEPSSMPVAIVAKHIRSHRREEKSRYVLEQLNEFQVKEGVEDDRHQ